MKVWLLNQGSSRDIVVAARRFEERYSDCEHLLWRLIQLLNPRTFCFRDGQLQ